MEEYFQLPELLSEVNKSSAQWAWNPRNYYFNPKGIQYCFDVKYDKTCIFWRGSKNLEIIWILIISSCSQDGMLDFALSLRVGTSELLTLASWIFNFDLLN